MGLDSRPRQTTYMLLSCFRRTKSFLFLGPKFEHERSSRAHHIYVQLRTSYIPCTPLPSPDIDIYTQTQQICLRFRCVYVWVFVKSNVYFRYTADKYDIYGFFHVITCLRFFVNLSTYTVVSGFGLIKVLGPSGCLDIGVTKESGG